jgi:hypothetical protein
MHQHRLINRTCGRREKHDDGYAHHHIPPIMLRTGLIAGRRVWDINRLQAFNQTDLEMTSLAMRKEAPSPHIRLRSEQSWSRIAGVAVTAAATPASNMYHEKQSTSGDMNGAGRHLHLLPTRMGSHCSRGAERSFFNLRGGFLYISSCL